MRRIRQVGAAIPQRDARSRRCKSYGALERACTSGRYSASWSSKSCGWPGN